MEIAAINSTDTDTTITLKGPVLPNAESFLCIEYKDSLTYYLLHNSVEPRRELSGKVIFNSPNKPVAKEIFEGISYTSYNPIVTNYRQDSTHNIGTVLKDGSYIIYLGEFEYIYNEVDQIATARNYNFQKYSHFITRQVERCVYEKPMLDDVCNKASSHQVKTRSYTHYLIEGARMNFRQGDYTKADNMIEYAYQICKYDDCKCTQPSRCN